jgi:hypothetical protein
VALTTATATISGFRRICPAERGSVATHVDKASAGEPLQNQASEATWLDVSRTRSAWHRPGRRRRPSSPAASAWPVIFLSARCSSP